MRILGLDVGEKRIGVAKVDSDVRVAVPLETVLVNGSEFDRLSDLASFNNTTFFVIGMPRSNEGNETAQSLYVRNFAKALIERIPNAKIRFQDESLTSVVAEERLRERGKPYRREDIDAEAAVIILEDFVENWKGERDFSLRTLRDQRGASEATDPRNDGREGAGPKGEIPTSPSSIYSKESKVSVKNIVKLLVVVVLIAGAVGGGLYVKHKLDERQARQEYYAQQEAEMEPDVFDFMIKPGETISEIKKNLAEAGYTEEEIEAGFNAEYNFDFLKERPIGASLEGYLFGDTHEFYKSATVGEILEAYLSEMGRVIEENNLEERYKAQNLTLFEGITLASIVQKEAPSPGYVSEQPVVAQIFLSRLAFGMKLGSDVTVTYALDRMYPNRDRDHDNNEDALKVDSCYNTRLNYGLPCGPISNPGLSALLAVAEPADTDYLYFLTGDDDTMYYGRTELEHEQNIRQNCQELCNTSL